MLKTANKDAKGEEFSAVTHNDIHKNQRLRATTGCVGGVHLLGSEVEGVYLFLQKSLESETVFTHVIQ